MALMKPALRQQIMSCLDESNLLPSSFNRETDDPFQLTPFSSSDLRGDLRSVVGFHHRSSSEERKLAWKDRAERLNARPVSGKFEVLPRTLVRDGRTLESALRLILVKDFQAIRFQFDKCFKRYEQKPTLYNKVENVYLKVNVHHKFYFHQHIPTLVTNTIFGHDF